MNAAGVHGEGLMTKQTAQPKNKEETSTMLTAKTTLLAALVIIGSLVFLGISKAQAGGRVGPFQLMHHANPTANPGVFRLDTTTGEVSYCYVAGSSTENASLHCLPGVQ